MTHPDYIRLKAIELRVSKKLTIDEIAERLAVSRSTVYHWVRHLPIERRCNPGQQLGVRAMQEKFRKLRDDAYDLGVTEFPSLSRRATFRDFVCMYIGEGTKRSRNTVAICNSDPAVVTLGARWIEELSARKVGYALQYHADQDLVELVRFWALHLEISHELIRLQRKSNSNQLRGRSWRSIHGVLTVSTSDTYLRSRMQAWMDLVRADWSREEMGAQRADDHARSAI